MFIKNIYKVNDAIKSPKVRLIDENGNPLGIQDLEFAKKYALEHELDLIEIASQSNPPVCKVLDYRKFRYNLKKKSKEARKKQKIIEVKEIWVKANISAHDFNTKLNHIKEFLKKGKKVKVTLKYRGREMTHKEIGAKIIDNVIEQCKDISNIETNPKNEGRNLILILSSKV